MKLATVKAAGSTHFGAVVKDGFVDLSAKFKGKAVDLAGLLAGNLLVEAARYAAEAKPDFKLPEVTFLPVNPRLDMRLFALGWAYKDHQLETGKEAPQHPNMFSKHPQSLVGHGQPLVRPQISDKYDYEGEIVIVIGKAGRQIPAASAMEHIAGYSILNDGSIRDFQKHSVTAGKNFDASSAFGPWIVTRDEIPDPKQMVLTTRLNGQEMQHSSFGLMAWDLAYLVSYVSIFCRLEPGDAISTGTPGGVGARRNPPVWMKAGDVIEIEVSGIGTLRNPIVDEQVASGTARANSLTTA
ncbi:MAG: FAA hydrolase family protein [Betaproteobacteria bacterium]|nr:MAG: FAA hydrolase family protein [Betaproteobacteria bacterium]